MNKNYAQNIILAKANNLIHSEKYAVSDNDVVEAIDTLMGEDCYYNSSLPKSVSVFYADTKHFCRDLSYTPTKTELSRDLYLLVKSINNKREAS